MTKQVGVGEIYFDWGVTANVEIIEYDCDSLQCKAKVVDSGVVYFARIDHLEPERKY